VVSKLAGSYKSFNLNSLLNEPPLCGFTKDTGSHGGSSTPSPRDPPDVTLNPGTR
jgi:hypothetical protein